jgi:voltage-gated potassium channel
MSAATLLVTLLVYGVIGYRWIESMRFLDALYMTVITITTVGFGEVKPLSDAGRIFTISLILSGVIVATYSLTTIATFLFAGEWRQYWRQRRCEAMISALRQHVIVCGFGRVGRHVVEELRTEKIPYAIIDKGAPAVQELESEGELVVRGDAAHEANLVAAGIHRARGLVACANSDAENVFIALTARSICPTLNIVARADFEESEPKLRRAGANRVIRPNHLAGRRMVNMLTRPDVADFLDEVTHTGGLELLVEQVAIAPSSSLAGIRLEVAREKHGLEATILAVRSADGRFQTPVDGNTLLPPGGLVIAIGTRPQIERTIQIAQR